MYRILYIDEVSRIAGAANCLIMLSAHLDRARYTPLVACPPGPLADQVTEVGITHIPFEFRQRRLKASLPGRLGQHNRRFFNPLALAQKVREGFEIARLIRQHQIDILQTNSLSAHIAGLVAGRLAGIPVFWHIHLFYPRWLYRVTLPEHVVFVSHALCRAAFPVTVPPQAHVIYNGRDLSVFDPDLPHQDLRAELGVPQGIPLVGITAQLLRGKGHRALLRAWQIVARRHPEARLVIVGDGPVEPGEAQPYRQELEQLARDLGVSQGVIFTGFRTDIVDVLHTLDILVSASTHLETFSLSVLEGMAMRKAVVATKVGGVPELITDGETALLVEDGNVPAMAAAIERFLDDPELRTRCGRQARQQALAKFSLQHYVSAFQALYGQALGDT